MTQMRLKTFSTWMQKTAVKVEDKVVKLREERQLLAQFLVIYQSRPELLPNLPGTIGEYEMAVTPRSMFSADGAQIPLHVLDVIMHDPKSIDIWSPDTDVLILLIDLVATHDNFSSKIF